MRDKAFYRALLERVNRGESAQIIRYIPRETIRDYGLVKNLLGEEQERAKNYKNELDLARQENSRLERKLGRVESETRQFLAGVVRKIKSRLEKRYARQYREDIKIHQDAVEIARRQEKYAKGKLEEARMETDRVALTTALKVLCHTTDYKNRAELLLDQNGNPIFGTPRFYSLFDINPERLQHITVEGIACRTQGGASKKQEGELVIAYEEDRGKLRIIETPQAIYRSISLIGIRNAGFLIEFPERGAWYRGLFRWSNVKGLLNIGEKRTDPQEILSTIHSKTRS